MSGQSQSEDQNPSRHHNQEDIEERLEADVEETSSRSIAADVSDDDTSMSGFGVQALHSSATPPLANAENITPQAKKEAPADSELKFQGIVFCRQIRAMLSD